MATSTQSRHPARAVIRTVFAFVTSLALIVPVVVEATGLDVNSFPWLAAVVGVAALVTRVLAVPAVNEFLQRWVFTSWLAAAPADEEIADDDYVYEDDFDWHDSPSQQY